eukprot:GFUD01010123.1.p1 GENE.GFUD01010123.1~~GFUD01010123.1.p1  ORF type:complete len:235 (-),score=60.06 GFUD01010123.1:4-708(-)
MAGCCWPGSLCGGGRGAIVCYLCGEDVSMEQWNCGDHRKQCASRNTAQLSSFPTHPAIRCAKCKDRLRIWPDQKSPLFYCDTDLPTCPCNGKEESSSGGNRYNCFLCDYDLCRGCVKAMESDCVINIEENPTFDKTAPDKGEGYMDENRKVAEGRKGSILLENDDIPLIDSQSESEDFQELAEKTRPKYLVQTRNMRFNPSVLDSPDIFHLRAPLVSCENILTPTISLEMLLDK